MNTLRLRLTMALASALIAGGALAGLVSAPDSTGTTGAGAQPETNAEPIVYAGSYGLYPAK